MDHIFSWFIGCWSPQIVVGVRKGNSEFKNKLWCKHKSNLNKGGLCSWTNSQCTFYPCEEILGFEECGVSDLLLKVENYRSQVERILYGPGEVLQGLCWFPEEVILLKGINLARELIGWYSRWPKKKILFLTSQAFLIDVFRNDRLKNFTDWICRRYCSLGITKCFVTLENFLWISWPPFSWKASSFHLFKECQSLCCHFQCWSTLVLFQSRKTWTRGEIWFLPGNCRLSVHSETGGSVNSSVFNFDFHINFWYPL